MSTANTVRSMAGRIGGNVRVSRITDMNAAMAPAWRGQLARFEREVDPDGTLPEPERQRRALAARKAHMARLALRSHMARRKAREAAAETAAVAAELAEMDDDAGPVAS